MATLGLSKVFILDKYFTELQKFWETEKKLQGTPLAIALDRPFRVERAESRFHGRFKCSRHQAAISIIVVLFPSPLAVTNFEWQERLKRSKSPIKLHKRE